jgi:hypothetical protein
MIRGASKLTNRTFADVLQFCPKIQRLEISGPSQGSGAVTKEALKLLSESLEAAPELVELVLANQKAVGPAACRKLSASRKDLQVEKRTDEAAYWFRGGQLVRVIWADRRTQVQPEDDQTDSDEGDDDEDKSYNLFLSSEFARGGYIDPDTGVLMPPNGEYWE